MEFLNKLCQNCHKPMNGGMYRAAHVCPHCLFEHPGGKSRGKRRFTAVTPAAQVEQAYAQETYAQEAYAQETDAQESEEEAYAEEVAAAAPAPARVVEVVLTTKPAAEHTIVESRAEVTAECVLNLKVTPDMVSEGKFVGTKSEKVRAALEQGKKHVLAQLRQKAQEQGANIVTDVAVKNSVKAADAQNVKMLVRASGMAAVAELAMEVSEV